MTFILTEGFKDRFDVILAAFYKPKLVARACDGDIEMLQFRAEGLKNLRQCLMLRLKTVALTACF